MTERWNVREPVALHVLALVGEQRQELLRVRYDAPVQLLVPPPQTAQVGPVGGRAQRERDIDAHRFEQARAGCRRSGHPVRCPRHRSHAA